MVYQVLVYFNNKRNQPLEIADTLEEFEKTTIRQLKEKLKSKFPEAPDPDDLRVIFGKDPLEDHGTLGFYKIKHLSVLVFVQRMPGGGGGPPPEGEDKGLPRTESMNRLAPMQQTEPECCML